MIINFDAEDRRYAPDENGGAYMLFNLTSSYQKVFPEYEWRWSWGYMEAKAWLVSESYQNDY